MHKLLIIGIDGADWEYVARRVDAGELPVLRDIAETGRLGPLASTAPPLSCPAWPAMTTGMGPESLGIYDLTLPDGYRKRAVNARDVAVPRLWDYVGSEGGRSVVMNVPVTWPPRPIQGVLVAGFLTPRGAQLSCPPGVGTDLAERFGYSPEHVPSQRGKLESVHRRTQAFLHLLEAEPWTLAMLVFSETDWAQHEHWEDRAFIDRLFDRVDAAAGEIIRRAGAENVAIISDHGFAGADRILNMNRLLANLGFLTYGSGAGSGTYRSNWELKHGRPARLWSAASRLVRPRRVLRVMHRLGLERALPLIPNALWHGLKSRLNLLDTPIDWSQTRAYLYNGAPQAIRLNLRGREPEGIVQPEDYDSACDALIEAMGEVTDPTDGGPVFASFRRRQDRNAGSRAELAPDVFFTVRDDTYVVSPADHPEVVWRTGRTRGRHRTNGVYALRGPAFGTGGSEPAAIVDMTPTLLAAMGLPVPEGLDGRPALPLLAGDAEPATRRYALHVAESAETADDGTVMRRLGDLGYL